MQCAVRPLRRRLAAAGQAFASFTPPPIASWRSCAWALHQQDKREMETATPEPACVGLALNQ